MTYVTCGHGMIKLVIDATGFKFEFPTNYNLNTLIISHYNNTKAGEVTVGLALHGMGIVFISSVQVWYSAITNMMVVSLHKACVPLKIFFWTGQSKNRHEFTKLKKSLRYETKWSEVKNHSQSKWVNSWGPGGCCKPPSGVKVQSPLQGPEAEPQKMFGL